MNLLELLRDSIIEHRLEEDYPTTWNAEEFSKLKSFNQRVKYAETNLKRISSGSSRIVYKIDDTKVLKLAKNKKGIAQNEVEIRYSQDYMWDSVVAQVFEYDENNLWLEMELARKLTPNAFKQITGFSFEEYSEAVQYTYNQANPRKARRRIGRPERYNEMFEEGFISEMMSLIGSYDDINEGDLQKTSSYGVVNRGGGDEVVLVDYGLTGSVYDSFYR